MDDAIFSTEGDKVKATELLRAMIGLLPASLQ